MFEAPGYSSALPTGIVPPDSSVWGLMNYLFADAKVVVSATELSLEQLPETGLISSYEVCDAFQDHSVKRP